MFFHLKSYSTEKTAVDLCCCGKILNCQTDSGWIYVIISLYFIIFVVYMNKQFGGSILETIFIFFILIWMMPEVMWICELLAVNKNNVVILDLSAPEDHSRCFLVTFCEDPIDVSVLVPQNLESLFLEFGKFVLTFFLKTLNHCDV